MKIQVKNRLWDCWVVNRFLLIGSLEIRRVYMALPSPENIFLDHDMIVGIECPN